MEQTNKINRIIFAIDIYDIHPKHVQYAQDYAKEQGATLHLINFVKKAPQAGHCYVGTADLDNANVKQAEQVLQLLKDDFSKLTTEVILGQPRELIKEYLNTNRADLLMLQGHHHWGLGAMGSFATFCIQNAPCNVLVLREPEA